MRMYIDRLLAVSSCVIALAALPCAAAAQSIAVTVTHGETGATVPGAFVSVLGPDGVVLQSGLTNASGEAAFRLVNEGIVTVRAELIGYAPQVSAALTLRQGESQRVRLVLHSAAIQLGAIRVEADERCELRPDAAVQVARVWESARTALRIQAWTEQEEAYRLNVSIWERDLDSSGRTISRESRRDRTRLTRTPFRSLPSEELLNGGFARTLEGGDTEWFAPDAELLLSDEFLDSHCFRLTRSAEQPGSIGLSFSPSDGGERTDIEGTFWIDEQSGHLQYLEYRYTSLRFEESRGLAHGRVEFQAMPNGGWIIRTWWIRVPILARDPARSRAGDSGIRVIAIRESGGEVTDASPFASASLPRSQRGSLGGLIWDSIASAPLQGARVQLSGTNYTTTSGTDGRFLLGNTPAGTYVATFTHPKLDTLGIDAPVVEATIVAGQTSSVALAIPSSETVVLSTCEVQTSRAGRTPGAAVSGIVADAALGEPIPGAAVRVEWQEVMPTSSRIAARNEWFEVRTDENGRYTACGVPIDEAVTIRASMLTYSSDATNVSFAEPSHRPVNLTIALPKGIAASDAIGADATTQRIQGTIIDAASGEPVHLVTVELRSIPSGSVTSTTTDERGVFRLEPALPGRYMVDASALGYRRLAGNSVDIVAGQTALVEIRMVPDALELEPIVVTTEQRSIHLEMEGFYRRKSDGLGVFMTPEVMERRKPRSTSDLLFGVPGINVAESTTAGAGRAVYFRDGKRGTSVCWPMIYLNRRIVSLGGITGDAEPAILDQLVAGPDIMALEVYRTRVEVPPEFSGASAGCGVIVLWTRSGRMGR